jgi:threonine/homoserine/homoserine lactone efflux protein
MSPASFLALTATVFVAAATPGPAVTAIVARAISDGARPALAVNAGVVTGDLLFFALAVAGMAAAAQSLANLFAVLKFAGAAYLVWQGVALWRTPVRMSIEGSGGRESRFWPNFGAGLLLMLGHVQALVFYAALLPGFVDFRSLTREDALLLALMLVLVIGSVNAGYALLAARARGLVASERALRALQRIAGSLMFVAAALVVTRV